MIDYEISDQFNQLHLILEQVTNDLVRSKREYCQNCYL